MTKPSSTPANAPSRCVCQSNHALDSAPSYQACCEPFHLRSALPKTPEALMRSRYSAFVLSLWDYLIETHHPDHLNGLTADILRESPHPTWLGLQIHQAHTSGDEGEVFFTAWYKEARDKESGYREAGAIDAICERSFFVRTNDKWFYTEGQLRKATFPGRNDLCVCGSGKKFKQCCLKH